MRQVYELYSQEDNQEGWLYYFKDLETLNKTNIKGEYFLVEVPLTVEEETLLDKEGYFID